MALPRIVNNFYEWVWLGEEPADLPRLKDLSGRGDDLLAGEYRDGQRQEQ